ncbi:MAG: formate dehydrogenase accessory sulfurtransferase FdhD [Vulcanimicrobiota bacterium]
MSRRAAAKRSVWRYRAEGCKTFKDQLATEEPLQIRVGLPGLPAVDLAVTMRTPGHDFELVAGFLFGEGLFTQPEQVESMTYCTDRKDQQYNVVRLHLRAGVAFDSERLRRNVYTTSSCGVCGKQSLDQLETVCPRLPYGPTRLDFDWVCSLPARLHHHQDLFERTGGLHAAAACLPNGELDLVREDVGRHNATDKLVGRLFLDGRLPADDRVLLLSGRASFELLQKAVMAGFATVVALGAPSTLAVELADRFQVTLIGFTKASGFNLYTGRQRLADT